MKKHLLTTASALTLLATQASANDITLVQSGTGNRAKTTQTDGKEGLVLIDQTGDRSFVNVTQEDESEGDGDETTYLNKVDIDQDGVARAVVKQIVAGVGSSNTADIKQFSIADEIEPPEDETEDAVLFYVDAVVTQESAGSTAVIKQGAAGANVAAASASVNQTGLNNKANVYQYGESSSASVTQGGGNNTSTINQELLGQGSDANVTQNGTDATSDITQNGSGNVAIVIQNDYNSLSTVSQFGSSGEVSVTQTGANESTVTQESTTGDTVKATVEQTSSGNESIIVQGKLLNGGKTTKGTVTVTQSGSNGKSEVTQWREDSSTVTLIQSGIGNISEIEQEDSESEASVTQSGTNGKSIIKQTSITDDTGRLGVFKNKATVKTSGTNTLSTINQHGYNSIASVTQSHGGLIGELEGIKSTIKQSGMVTATVLQTSSGGRNVVEIDQSNLNEGLLSSFAVVHQTEGSDHRAAVYQIGGGHEAHIYQTGEWNNATISQIKDAAYAIVTQSGTRNRAEVFQ